MFVNYGFVSSAVEALMHPRGLASRWPPGRRQRAQLLLEFVRERGSVHPREVDRHFSHGRVTNYWGGSSSATTHLMELMHYGGLLRVVRREAGIRIYAPARARRRAEPERDVRPGAELPSSRRIDALVDVAVRIYAPLPARPSRRWCAGCATRRRSGTASWEARCSARGTASRTPSVDGIDWYWPAGERPSAGRAGRA